MAFVALAAAALLVVGLLTWCLDLRDDRDLLSALYDGARCREADAVRRAERAEQRLAASQAHVAALSTFSEEPPARPIRRVA